MTVEAWIAGWRGSVEGAGGLLPGPQLVEGTFECIVGGGLLGRAAAVRDGNWTERWAVTDPQALRTQPNPVVISAIPALDPDPKIDWMTSPLLLQGLASPVRQARDSFVYQPMPAPPTTPPPASTVDRYKVFTVTATGAVQSGALYRQSLQAGGQDAWWFDHWSLWTNYVPPTIGGAKLRLDKDNPAGTFAAFLGAQPAGAKYALVELEWKAP